MTAVADSIEPQPHACVETPCTTGTIRIALLGVGQVGGAVAALAADPGLHGRFAVVSGLVRDPARQRPHAASIPLTSSADRALEGSPQVVIEALGGLEPARTLVIEALNRGIPVVTANKSLLAAHGEELLEHARRSRVPLRYEAAVVAGVPFLHTLSARPLAREVSALSGIVNGTTNFILSRMSDEGSDFAGALHHAQRNGFAEPDPRNDVNGIDAVEKLCILLRLFGGWLVRASDVEVEGIGGVEYDDIQAAARLDGRIRPVVHADWSTGRLTAFCGPAFLPSSDPLASVNGVQNAVLVRNSRLGDLFFAGAGAGPLPTAATLLDDALEALATRRPEPVRTWKHATPTAPATGWFVRVGCERAPDEGALGRLFEAQGVHIRRTVDCGAPNHWCVLTQPCDRERVTAAVAALSGNGVASALSCLRSFDCGR